MDFSIIKTNLEKKGYIVSCFETGKEAVAYMAEKIQNTTVGFGGSMTTKELGLYEKLAENNAVYWHWLADENNTRPQLLKSAGEAKVYISSVNGIAESGEIINIDGTGNRIAETIFGHDKVYFVIGKNKIAADMDKAMWRARNIASPLNCKRLNLATPCAKGDKCYDCQGSTRICNVFSVFAAKPGSCEYEIILINEDLGY